MTGTAVTTVVGLGTLAEIHDRDLPQKDNLCGCFWGAIALAAAGVESADGEPLDQDRVAAEAGTVLPEGDPATFVPRGAASRQDYRLELPTTADPALGGTAAPALARAIERLAQGRLAVVPVAGPWAEGLVLRLVEAAADCAPATTLVANISTAPLWGSRPHPSSLLAHLAGADVDGPEPEWNAGHFVNIAAAIRGPARALLAVRDSYRSQGWDGYHLQPAAAFAAALERADGREGGVLSIVPSSGEAVLRARLAEEGFSLRYWDNGTPDPR